MIMPRVLFVCLGNICRSPLAEAAFHKAADDAGFKAEADSAGTAAYHIGMAPDPRSIAEAARHGVDISRYAARQITNTDYITFTHIFALDQENLRDIRQRAPHEATALIGLLLDVVPRRSNESVADPYYGSAQDFAATWRDVDAAAQSLVSQLRKTPEFGIR